MPIVVGDKPLTVEDVVRVARQGEPIELAGPALERIRRCRQMLESKIDAHEIMYGVNTGIGELSEVTLTDDQVQQFQRFLIYNHAAGIGRPCPIEHVRAAMLSRIAVHCHGHSGGRPEITHTYLRMLNQGLTPVVCDKGSVGACGDLAPMSQIALCLMGEGEVLYKGERMPSRIAMQQAGIPIPGLMARDGLASINGSNLITGMACLELYDAERWLKQAEIGAAMCLEALLANMRPYEPALHSLRGFRGAQTCAANLLAVTEGSDLHLVFELVTGQPLHLALQRVGRLKLDTAAALIKQVGSALDFAHANRVIHRDLKPANVMLTPQGSAKVMDFGLAHQASMTVAKLTHAESWGTPPYMAPEQELGTVSRESDLYALGVMLYESVTGNIPFPGPNFLAQKREMRFAPPSQDAPGLPAGLDDVVRRALEADPARRFHSAAEMVEALGPWATS